MLIQRGLVFAVVAGAFCFDATLVADEKPRKQQSVAEQRKVAQLEAAAQRQERQAERIRGNERGDASEFVGKWRMRLPAGFVYTVELKQLDNGLLRMTCAGHALTLLGDFACKENQLLLVRADQPAVDDYIWIFSSGKFILIKDDQRHGAIYLGAVLTRLP
jgi:hypothetical protein